MKSSIIRNDFVLLGLFIITVILIYIQGILFPFLTLPFDTLLLVLGLTLLTHKLRIDKSMSALGLNCDKSAFKNSVYAILFVIVTVIVLFVVSQFLNEGQYFRNTFTSSIVEDDASNLFGVISISILNILILAVLEELVFRGVAFQIIIDMFGNFVGLFISSLVFTIFHLNNPGISVLGVINIFLAGVLIGLMYTRGRSLYPMFMFHFMWNFALVYIIGSPLSGKNFSGPTVTISNQSMDFHKILLGDVFGFEEALLSTILFICMIIFVNKHFRK